MFHRWLQGLNLCQLTDLLASRRAYHWVPSRIAPILKVLNTVRQGSRIAPTPLLRRLYVEWVAATWEETEKVSKRFSGRSSLNMLVDSNVILDLLTNEERKHDRAERTWQVIHREKKSKQINVYVTPETIREVRHAVAAAADQLVRLRLKVASPGGGLTMGDVAKLPAQVRMFLRMPACSTFDSLADGEFFRLGSERGWHSTDQSVCPQYHRVGSLA